MHHYVGIDNVCAWPNLTQLADGSICATIFNQPCHGKWEGDVEVWGSTDGGTFWQRRGVAAPHEPKTNRMNVAAGVAPNGELILLASGWSNRNPVGQPSSPHEGEVLPVWICRSADNGYTWCREGEVALSGARHPVPFGDILYNEDGVLYATVYGLHAECAVPEVGLLASDDNGKTWYHKATIADDGNHNETALLNVGGGRWLAVARTASDVSLDLFVSGDDGATWQFQQMLTGPMMAPAHLLRLRDGRIVLTYGIRHRGCYGVGFRFSDDGGRSWARQPRVLVNFEKATDGGYPSTVENDDGTLVTAWYANATGMHNRYHMGVTQWRLEA